MSTLREEHTDLRDAHSTLLRTSTQTTTSQKSQITTLTRQISLLEDDLQQSKRIAEERRLTVEELQERYDELSSAQDSIARNGAEQESMGIVREELHRQAEYFRVLESTNIKLAAELSILKERHASIEVLREEKRGLERKLKTLDELREKVVRLEAEVEAGRKEREKLQVASDFQKH